MKSEHHLPSNHAFQILLRLKSITGGRTKLLF